MPIRPQLDLPDNLAHSGHSSEHRGKRAVAKQTQARHKALGLPEHVPLLPEQTEDGQQAELMTFGDDR